MKRFILFFSLLLMATVAGNTAERNDIFTYKSHKSAGTERERTLTYITTMQSSLHHVVLPTLESHLSSALTYRQNGEDTAADTELEKATAVLSEIRNILDQTARDRAQYFPDDLFLLRRENKLREELRPLQQAYDRQHNGLPI